MDSCALRGTGVSEYHGRVSEYTPDDAPGPSEPREHPLELEEIPRSRGTLAGDPFQDPGRARRRLGTFLGITMALLTAGVFVALWQADSGAANFLKAAAGKLGKQSEKAIELIEGELTEDPIVIPADIESTTIYSPTGDAIPGILYFDSTPDGASVRVNGRTLGLTPLAIDHELEDGEVTVVVVKSGYARWRRRVDLVDGSLRVDATLRRK